MPRGEAPRHSVPFCASAGGGGHTRSYALKRVRTGEASVPGLLSLPFAASQTRQALRSGMPPLPPLPPAPVVPAEVPPAPPPPPPPPAPETPPALDPAVPLAPPAP